MLVYLIRHTSVDVNPGICYGQSDVPLKSTFPQEAEITRSQLKGIKFDKVYCSPLSRAVRLAEYCGYGDAQIEKRVMEINFGDWELKPFDSITDKRLDEWFKDYIHVPATNGESFLQQYTRVAEFLDELKKMPYEKVAVFAHGGVLISAQIYAGKITIEQAFSTLTPYGGIIKIEI